MMEILSWISNNGAMLLQLYFAIIAVASIIVKMTPTLKDDTVLKKVVSFIGKFIALNR